MCVYYGGGRMKEYNDYVGMTRRYLKSYKQFQITIENLSEDINAQKQLLNSFSVPISRYGDEPGGGTSELNQVEAAAYHRDETKKKILELEGNIAELERILHKLDRAMEGLGEQDKDIIKSYYIEGDSWQQIGHKNYYTEKWARDRGNRALKDMAFMIFGIVAKPQQLRFVFAG